MKTIKLNDSIYYLLEFYAGTESMTVQEFIREMLYKIKDERILSVELGFDEERILSEGETDTDSLWKDVDSYFEACGISRIKKGYYLCEYGEEMEIKVIKVFMALTSNNLIRKYCNRLYCTHPYNGAVDCLPVLKGEGIVK